MSLANSDALPSISGLEKAPHRFSHRSTRLEEPNSRVLFSSLSAGWTSILATVYESNGVSDVFEKAATPDQTLVVMTQGQSELQCRSAGKWRTAIRRPGSSGLTPGDQSDTLRWRALGAPFLSLHLHIPQSFLLDAADEYQRAGSRFRVEPLDGLALLEPVIAEVSQSIVRAVAAGAPDLYAESATQFIVRHLLGLHNEWTSEAGRERVGRIAKRRLLAVIEYMRVNYARPLTLERLSSEACVSRHHFGYLFKRAIGVTPHRFLTELRLDASASLLTETDKSVSHVALSCGFYTVAHFSSAFRRRFNQSPTAYRLSRTPLASHFDGYEADRLALRLSAQ